MPMLFYIEVNLICIIILLLFRSQLRHKSERFSTGQIIFNRLLCTAIVLCAADTATWCANGQHFWGARALASLSNMLFFESTVVVGFLWARYVPIKLCGTSNFNERHARYMAIPLAAFTLLVLTNPWTEILFSIDADNVYVRGPGIALHWVAIWFYMLVPSLQTAQAIAREKSRMWRHELAPLLYFVIAPAVATIAQILFYGVTTTQVGLTISIVMVCLSEQSSRVLTDALTGLNNRRGLENYLEDRLQRHAGAELTFMMIDLNNFKGVNDKFGHMTGDRALKSAADALRQACRVASSRLFLCRFGGDEFVIAGTRRSDAELHLLCAQIHTEMQKKALQSALPCELTLSIGTASGVCTSSEDTEKLLRTADEAMYREKQARKLKGSTD